MKQDYKDLEERYSKFVSANYAVSCNTGTSALHLAFMAIKLQPGDEVIMSDFVMGACAFAVSYTGAKPVFVDCGDDLQIDTTKIEAKITKNTKAILAVHIYGKLCNMLEIYKIASKHNLYVIEDACEAQGAIYKSKADITVYSFFRNKIISAEEGGICTTNNQELADRMNYLKNMAFDIDHTYYHAEIGYNYRMSNAQARLAIKSLLAYKTNKENRQRVVDEYDRHFGQYRIKGTQANWVYDIVLPSEGMRNLWYDKLKKAGIQVRLFFKPMTELPMYHKPNKNSRANFFSQRGLYLPIDPKIRNREIFKIKRIVNG